MTELRIDDKTNTFDTKHTATTASSPAASSVSLRSNEAERVAGASERGGATVFQTSLNVSKMCMGTGTLALPFAAERGGLVFNIVGLGLIGLWNYYCSACLLRCLDIINGRNMNNRERKGLLARGGGSLSMTEVDAGNASSEDYGSIENGGRPQTGNLDDFVDEDVYPPDGTTTFGVVAWYAAGPKGLMMLDMLMMLLFFGIVLAYEGTICLSLRLINIVLIASSLTIAPHSQHYKVAMQTFIDGTPLTDSSLGRKVLLIPSAIVALLSCVPDIGFLARFSGMGLLAIALSFL